MSLHDDIRKMREEFMEQVPDEVVQTMKAATQRLIDSGIEKRCLKTGERLPSFSLPNARGKMISSDTLLSKGPLVINFYRGGWCPYCNLELRAFQDAASEINAQGAQLVAISPNLPDNSLSSIEKHSLSFEVLSDIGNRYSRKLGLVYTLDEQLQALYRGFDVDIPAFNGDETHEIPIPATYVVNSEGIVELAFVDADYTKRLEPEKVIKCLKNMSEKDA